MAEFRSGKEAGSRRRAKLVHFWVPDTSATGFADEARRQALLLKDEPEEAEALAFIEAVGWPEE